MSWPSMRDAARGRVVEAVEQPGEGRLAGARRADDRDCRARRDVEVEAFQDLAFGVVAELDVLEPNMALGHDQRLRRRARR